jgi:hypothetical protein
MCFDQGRLRALRAEYGSQGAADLLARAADDIGRRMAVIDRLADADSTAALAREARGIGRIGAETGLLTIVVAAAALADCALRDDSPARAATRARLGRVVNRTLPALRHLRGGLS